MLSKSTDVDHCYQKVDVSLNNRFLKDPYCNHRGVCDSTKWAGGIYKYACSCDSGFTGTRCES